MGFSHVYTPFTCQYRMYDGPACLTGKRVLFLGNSRTGNLGIFFKRLLSTTEFIDLMPFNVGIRAMHMALNKYLNMSGD